MDDFPLVTVVVPAYNSAGTIVKCLDSVKKQTYSAIEIIVVNDGSKDNTQFIVEEYISEHKSVDIFLINQKNAGPSAARNKGIDYATGEFVAFLDSDDEWLPHKLEKQLICFEDSDVGLVGCRYIVGDNICLSGTGQVLQITKCKLLFHNYFSTPSVVCRLSILKKCKFDEMLRYSEDYRLWLVISCYCKCVLIDDLLVKLDDKPTFGAKGLSGNLWKMWWGELSNYNFLFSARYIGLVEWVCSLLFSTLKFVRRYFLTLLYKLDC
ncbi:glycosyltransferase family 2 protein [Phocaeicola sp.]